jgi:DNA repair protein SbcD/Mre11
MTSPLGSRLQEKHKNLFRISSVEAYNASKETEEMMMRFMFYTDSHLAGENPRHRVDDFPRAILGKLSEAYATAESEGCQFVAFGGDFFNNHRIFSYEVISDVMDILCGSSLRTYMVVGEHDLYGHSIDTYRSSTLAFMVKRCPNVEILWEPPDFGEIVLYGKHEPDTIEKAMGVVVDPDKVNILICHELLTCNPMPYDVVDTASLHDCPYDLVMSGDLHDGFDTHRVGKTWFCNPGSLARRTTADADRWPQIALVTVEKGKEPSIELRRLECGKSGLEVFGESIAETARAMQHFDGDGFVKELLEFEAESTDVHELVQKAGAKAGLRKEVLEYLAKKRTDKIEEAA